MVVVVNSRDCSCSSMSVAVVGLKGRMISTKHNPTRNRRLWRINIGVRSKVKVNVVWEVLVVFVLLIPER